MPSPHKISKVHRFSCRGVPERQTPVMDDVVQLIWKVVDDFLDVVVSWPKEDREKNPILSICVQL